MPWPVTLNGITFTDADFSGTAYVTGLPKAFENAVTHLSNIFVATSATSQTVGTGSKTFTATTARPYAVGTFLRIANTAAPSTIWMDGAVTAYNSSTGALTVNVTAFAGSGTLAAWTINLSGGGYAVGSPVTVAQGGTGATTAATAIANLGGLPLAGGAMTGAIILNTDPSADLHPVTKQWAERQAHKDACRVASTATVTLTAPGTAIDGITLSVGDRVLLKNQTASAENGIYIFQGSAATMTRATDMDAWTDVPNAATSVEEGTANGNTIWLCQNTATGTLGTTAITWQLVSNAQVAALGAVATTGLLNRTGANTVSTLAVASASTASAVVQRDASADILTNNIVLGNGSVGAPAVRAASDANTGIRFSGADIMYLVTGGADRLAITATDIVPAAASNILWSVTGDHYVGYAPTVDHAAGNVNTTYFGTDDGGNMTGLAVTNFREGTVNSQQVDIKTAKGSISLSSTRARFTCDGYSCFGNGAATTAITPGYAGNTDYGQTFWPTGRTFIYQDSFSNWGMNGTGVLVGFQYQNTGVGSIGITSTTTAYNTTSDYRLKQDAEPLTGALDRLDLLQPRRFRFKSDPTGPLVDGFFAHEAAVAVPESVTGEHDATDFGGNPEYQAMDAAKLVPLLVAAVQELRAQVVALQA